MEVRTGRLVNEQPPGLFTQHTDIFDCWWRWYGLWHRRRIRHVVKIQIILAQGEWSIAKDVGPILKRCNKRQRQTFCDIENVYVFNITSICFHGNGILRKFSFHQKYRKRSHNEKDVWHIWKVDSRTIRWDLWSEYNKLGRFFMETFLSMVGDEQVISLLHTKVYVFSDSVPCLGKMNQNPKSNIAWEDRLKWFKSSPQYRTLDKIDGEPVEFEWNIFPGFTTLQLSEEVKSLLLRLGETPEKFTGRIIFMSMFNDISCGSCQVKKLHLKFFHWMLVCAWMVFPLLIYGIWIL